jgi:hypothetical protein
MLGSRGWWLLRLVGLNYIAYAFAVDFLRVSPEARLKHVIEYLPFAVLCLVGPMLFLAALMHRAVHGVEKLFWTDQIAYVRDGRRAGV